MKVSVDAIVWPDERARARYTEEQRAYLRASLGRYGQLSEILVRPRSDGRYEGIDGESRFKELVEAGAREVDVKVLHLDDRDASMVNLLMNVARGEQDPMGSSYAIVKALETGMTEEEVAASTGHAKEWVRFMKGLQKLPPVYQEALRQGRIKVTHVREALRLPDLHEADAALSAAITHGWNTSVMHHYVNNRMAEYQAARVKSETMGVTVPPPPPEPERLVKYGQCLVCGSMVPREEINLPAVCTGCYELAKYVTSQCGTGEEGMQRVYKALELQQAWDARQRQFFLEQDLRKQPPATPSPHVGSEPTNPLPERPVVIEDDKLRAHIKRIMREELERQQD